MTKPIAAANGTALSILEIIHQDLATVERLLRPALAKPFPRWICGGQP